MVCFCDTWEVYKVEVYGRLRRAVQVAGMSERQAARESGLSRKTIRKMLQFSAPPGYQRKKPVARPELGPWLGLIGQILEDDEARPKKQRHTARRIYGRLKDEHAFTGGYTIVKDYVRQARVRHKEVFVPLAHPPGDAPADFGEALVVIGRVEQKGHSYQVSQRKRPLIEKAFGWMKQTGGMAGPDSSGWPVWPGSF